MWVYGLDFAGSGKGHLAGTCEFDKESPGSIQCEEFLD